MEKNYYKDRFIALLSERDELIKEEKYHREKANEVRDRIDDNKNKIDRVFDEMCRDDNDLYQGSLELSPARACVRFERDNNLVEISRYMGYSRPIDRIRIDKREML